MRRFRYQGRNQRGQARLTQKGGFVKRTLVAALALAVFLVGQSYAVNGFSVTTAYRTGNAPEAWAHLNFCGKLVRFDITNNAVSGYDTIHKGLGWYPSISFDGTRIAFFRSKATLSGGNLSGSVDTGYISMIDKNGGNLRDLVKLYAGSLGYSCFYADCEGGFVDWPAGDWIYYEKPPKTGEIWRINADDPSLHHMVVRYTDFGVRPANCACDVSGSEGFWLRRWQLSADAMFCGGMFKVYPDGQQLGHRFPPPEGYAPLTIPLWANLPACNLCMSASGEYLSAYSAGCHDVSGINRWDHVTNVGPRYQDVSSVNLYTDVRTWCGRDVGNLGQYMRWAANSDKWLLVQTGYNCNGNGSSAGNQVLCNWKDRTGLCPTGTTAGGSLGYDAGDFWINDPVRNPNGDKYEDVNGNWVSVTPRDIYLTWTVSGTNPYQVSLSAYPADAGIRYTTDGSDPTQSSDLYTAQLNLTATGRATMIKARAFRTGMNPSATESRILVPSTKALPAGYIKEMLCLETAQGSMVVPMADSAGVWAKYVGANKAIPYDGDQVTVNGHTYTWHLRSDDDGVWSPATGSNSLSFWYTTIVTPQSRMAKVGARFHTWPKMIRDGVVVWFFDGWDSNHEWIFGSGDGASIGLIKGANGLLMQQHADGVFGLRLLNGSNNDLTDLSYYPYVGTSAARGRAGAAAAGGVSVAQVSGGLVVRVPGGVPHTVRISDAAGRVERQMEGAATYRLDAGEVGRGVHLVTVTSGATETTWRVLTR